MSLETLETCPVCNNTSFENFLNVTDYTVSQKEFTIQKCITCQFLFTNPRPDESEIGDYYQSQDYISHNDQAKGLISKVYGIVRDYTIGQKVKMINNLSNGKGKLLDIGCGTGNFVNAGKENGWNVFGTEPDPNARNAAAAKTGNIIFESIQAPELISEKFDIITMWHVLEHVHYLNETLDWLDQHINQNGTILIAVPNPESYDAANYGRYWAAYDVPRHLYHFTKNTMQKLLGNHGLTIQQTLPMWFDSFYVGMLSTKYKGQKVDIPDSIKTGLVSNWKGRSTEEKQINTSSIIYVIKKK
ncbi:class I SAM-dependent methyltransferase [Dyadobacter sp. CY323]|uniref:class I SAM-dependent methyltransferase n=1 Tax=Dyadobacter sp. CY323 TaxID=2907302 RepID=UPI001F361188|nr:class I SAM-dependent methyltransferase [Dyadobacter sp. CY323]MCE6993096.1 class I SAM-dependent methyltransferase [Dyadobacter sp. CY323]